ncbi:MAG: signal peptide peptidase SppA [bacterium]
MSFLKTMLASMLGTFITIVVLSFISFAVVVGIIVAVTADEEVTISPKTVLYLDFAQPITERTPKSPFIPVPTGMGKSVGLDDILKNISKAKEDENISGIYLNTENLMAGISKTTEIRDALNGFKESGKFVIAYGNYYTQSSYYLATAADQVYLNPEGSMLFKGLNAQLMFLKGTLEKLDVDVQIIRHGKFKSAAEPLFLDKMSPENRQQITELITSVWDKVLTDISDSRNIGSAELNRMADSLLIQTADDALDYKLVDKLLYKDELLAALKSRLELDSSKKVSFVSLDQYMNVTVKKRSTSVNKIAVIYATGDVVDGEGTEETIGGDRISRTIRKVREDKKVKAVVFRINSGGGSALASEVIWREIALTAKEKPVVASFGDVAASGGYYIACASTKIMADPTTITGSIGVWAAIPNLKGLMNNKLGITFDNAKTNTNADFISVMQPLTPYQMAVLQKDVDHIYEVFSSHVSEGRKLSMEKVDSLGQGRIWSGNDALKLGLVDTLGGLDAAIGLAAKLANLTDYRLSALPVLKDPIDQLIEELTGKSTPDVYLKNALGADYEYYLYLKQLREMKGVQARLPYRVSIY